MNRSLLLKRSRSVFKWNSLGTNAFKKAWSDIWYQSGVWYVPNKNVKNVTLLIHQTSPLPKGKKSKIFSKLKEMSPHSYKVYVPCFFCRNLEWSISVYVK